MKKLLFVVHTLQIGGAEKVLINILNNIDKSKYDITVLAIVDDGVFVKEVKNMEDVKYKYIFKSFFKKTRTNKKSKFYKVSNIIMGWIWKRYLDKIKNNSEKLYKKNIKEKYDIEIAFLEGKVAKFVSSSNNPSSKKIVWIHTDINNICNTSIFKDIYEEKECYRKFNKIVCVSREVKDRFIQRTSIDKNICVQINPIDSNQILEMADEDIKLKEKSEELIVCTVGRLVEAKGYDRLLEVHKRLINESINYKLWIVGEGKERKKLEDFINKNKINETVKLLGYKKNPYKYIKEADIFVCASRIEGLSSAVLEATILGKVIVSTDCPGIKDIVGENNKNALVVSNNTEGIYNGLKEILTNEKLREKYTENIKKRSKLVDLENTIKQIEKIIDE